MVNAPKAPPETDFHLGDLPYDLAKIHFTGYGYLGASEERAVPHWDYFRTLPTPRQQQERMYWAWKEAERCAKDLEYKKQVHLDPLSPTTEAGKRTQINNCNFEHFVTISWSARPLRIGLITSI